MEGKFSRQNLIAQGVSFLKETATNFDPLSKKIQFLESKGLSGPEILESIKNAEQSIFTNSEKWISNNILSSAIVIGVGCITYALTSSLLDDSQNEMHQLVEDDHALVEENTAAQDSVGDLERAFSENPASKLDDLINELTRVETALNKMTVALETYNNNAEKDEPKWIKEVSSKITTLIDEQQQQKKISPPDSNSKSETQPSLPNSDLHPTPSATEVSMPTESSCPRATTISTAQRLEEISVAVKTLGTDSKGIPTEQKLLTAGCGALIMYLKNILEHPDVPRYRKIITSNQNFKSLVQPLENYVAVLHSVGFVQKTPGSFEWAWVSGGDGSPSEADRSQLLRQAILQLTTRMTGCEGSGPVGSLDADASAGGGCKPLDHRIGVSAATGGKPVACVPGFLELLKTSASSTSASNALAPVCSPSSYGGFPSSLATPHSTQSGSTAFAGLSSLQYEELNPVCDGEYHFAS